MSGYFIKSWTKHLSEDTRSKDRRLKSRLSLLPVLCVGLFCNGFSLSGKYLELLSDLQERWVRADGRFVLLVDLAPAVPCPEHFLQYAPQAVPGDYHYLSRSAPFFALQSEHLHAELV